MKFINVNRQWYDFACERNNQWNVGEAINHLNEAPEIFVMKIQYLNWDAFRKENEVAAYKLKLILWKRVLYNDLCIYVLVENKITMFIERIILAELMYDIEEMILEMYPEEIEVRRERAIDICRKEKDIISEKEDMRTINNLNRLMNLLESIVMFKVKSLTLQVTKLIEGKVFELYPIDIEMERKKYLEICRNEEDIFGKREFMKTVVDMDRWKWQIRGIWKEAKAKKLVVQKRAFKKNSFFEPAIRGQIKCYKEKTHEFRDYDKVLKKVSKENTNWKIDGEKLLFKEYEKYYGNKYMCREKKCREYNKAESYEMIRRAIYPVKCNRKVLVNPYLQKLMSIRLKYNYWETVHAENIVTTRKCIRLWKEFGVAMLKRPLAEAKQKKAVCDKGKEMFEKLMKFMKEKLQEKVVHPAKIILEKEKKAKSKKIRRKFREIADSKIINEKKNGAEEIL
jgi:hypothetical protein